jgi:uncharacterized membrane protein
MLGLLRGIGQRRRLPRWEASSGSNYYALAILAVIGGFILIPGLAIGIEAALLLGVLAIICFCTIILAPMGCFLL